MPNIGPVEMVFVLVLLLLIFGAKRLPELGSGLGKGIREFKRSISDIKDEVDRPERPNQIHQPPPRQQVPSANVQETREHEPAAREPVTGEPAPRNDS